MRKTILFAFLCMLSAIGCTQEEYDGDGQSLGIVVEGWIEADGFPVVKLTRTIPILDDFQSLDSLPTYIMRWQRLTLSDGEREVTLTGRYDRRYFPPYIYTTTDMRGEAGKTYHLTIHNDDGTSTTLTATVPEPVETGSFSIGKVSCDTLRQLFLHLRVPRYPVTYYKLSVRTDANSRDFLPSLLGVFRSDMPPSDGRIAVNRGRTNLTKEYTPYFHTGDTVVVRLCQIDSAAYSYWRAYEDMLSLSRNPLVPSTTNMPSVAYKVYGYWQGYGSTYATVTIPEE